MMHPNAEHVTEDQWEALMMLMAMTPGAEEEWVVDFPYKPEGIMVATPPSMIAIFIEPDGKNSQGIILERTP
jgi:hypothetical protein